MGLPYSPTTWLNSSAPAINATNLNKLEQGLVDLGSRAVHLQRFVDPVNGNDANSGLSWMTAFETIQAAYDELVTVAEANYTVSQGVWMGVGRINLSPGDHDVGAGLDIDGFRPVDIYGYRGGLGGHQISDSASRIVSSSSSATYMARVWHNDAISRGCRFRDIAFRPDTAVNTSMTNLILLISNIYSDIRECSFDVADSSTASAIIAICQEADPEAQDQMAGRFIDNWSARMQFYKGSGGNLNRIAVEKNKCNNNHATAPTIELLADCRAGSISNNQLEGTATQIKVTNADNCYFAHNGGESSTTTNPYMHFTGTANRHVVIGGDVTCPASTGVNGIYVKFDDPTQENTYIGPGSPEGSAGYKMAVIDNSYAVAGNRVVAGRQRGVTALKTAAYDILRINRLTRCDSTAGAFTVRLPAAAHILEETYTVRNYGSANAVTVGSVSGTIVGATSLAAGESATYMTDGQGGNWWQV